MNGFFENELSGLRRKLIRMGREVELNVAEAAGALLTGDAARGELVVARDRDINDLENSITDQAILLIATRQPVAGDLRFLTACLRLATELERIGDQAANLGRRTRELVALSDPRPLPDELKVMSREARAMLEAALDALTKSDPALARSVLERDDRVDELYRLIRADIIKVMAEDGGRVAWGLEVINAASNLERLGDHATNLAEEVIFVVRGRNVRHQPEAVAAVGR